MSHLPAEKPVLQRYQEGLTALVNQIQQDSYVLAVVLCGSLSNDVVWDKSDIDLVLVVQETKQKTSGLNLVVSDINVHAALVTRAEFKKAMEGSVQSSFMHSMLIKGRVLWSRDETLEELWANRTHFGLRDREISLLRAVSPLLWALPKAQKWLHVKQDAKYSYVWALRCIESLAAVETILAGEITGREVIWQGLAHNPRFFNAVYTEMMDAPKTLDNVGATLAMIESYVRERVSIIYRPIFDYLAETDGVRSAREIDHYFSQQMNLNMASFACEWLADEGLIQKVAVPTRITEKSRIDVEEAAYYYEKP